VTAIDFDFHHELNSDRTVNEDCWSQLLVISCNIVKYTAFLSYWPLNWRLKVTQGHRPEHGLMCHVWFLLLFDSNSVRIPSILYARYDTNTGW